MDERWIIELDVNKQNEWRIVSENWFRRPDKFKIPPEDMVPRSLEECCEQAATSRFAWTSYQEGTMRLKCVDNGEIIAYEIFT